MAELGDELLIKRIKANDQKALELLFEKYYFPYATLRNHSSSAPIYPKKLCLTYS
ncbi:hypothetical protein SAMN05444682_114136 [Parapedobacter indicus]|uniref:Uncharacterized protein n=1 Tax=Parapedobacter indicus TaxID=1477437 RepID=A0A1I3UFK2_9SPHI|nr:hypothetical protein CLV26_114136 [Parapedobacter indicus]SFJ81810.1 hypothetical protein SAMN05444682_114136 [Parapedobacter indicus]